MNDFFKTYAWLVLPVTSIAVLVTVIFMTASHQTEETRFQRLRYLGTVYETICIRTGDCKQLINFRSKLEKESHYDQTPAGKPVD